MKLYLISQDKNTGWDTYDSAVVAAESEEQARMTHPSGKNNWDGEHEDWGAWCASKYVNVKLIGTADNGTDAGVICASFNAG